MSADVVIGWLLVAAGTLVLAIAWLFARAADLRDQRRPGAAPVARTFYQCQQRGCTARATRIVLMVAAITETRVVCDSDRDRLTITGSAIDLGPIYRGQA